MINWQISDDLVGYTEATQAMEQKVADIAAGNFKQTIWLLEHPALYTIGASGDEADIKNKGFIPYHKTARGGQVTYHGPGQLICYIMLDLNKQFNNKPDIRQFVWQIEQWVINVLAKLNIKGERWDNNRGIFVRIDGEYHKIASIGIKVRKGITYHGFALNINPDLSHFDNITPCGIEGGKVISIAKLGGDVDRMQVIELIKQSCEFV